MALLLQPVSPITRTASLLLSTLLSLRLIKNSALNFGLKSEGGPWCLGLGDGEGEVEGEECFPFLVCLALGGVLRIRRLGECFGWFDEPGGGLGNLRWGEDCEGGIWESGESDCIEWAIFSTPTSACPGAESANRFPSWWICP